MSQKELQGISSKEAVQKLLETKSVDYYQMVKPANRIGTIIYWIVEQREKEIEIIEDINDVSFYRKVKQIVNIGPDEVLKLDL